MAATTACTASRPVLSGREFEGASMTRAATHSEFAGGAVVKRRDVTGRYVACRSRHCRGVIAADSSSSPLASRNEATSSRNSTSKGPSWRCSARPRSPSAAADAQGSPHSKGGGVEGHGTNLQQRGAMVADTLTQAKKSGNLREVGAGYRDLRQPDAAPARHAPSPESGANSGRSSGR